MQATAQPAPDRHPVWDIYDDYRTAVMNVKIQKCELERLQRLNFWIEIPLAITASSSIAGLWLWSDAAGGAIWSLLGAITAVLAVIKPLLQIPEKIQRRGEMLADFSSIESDLEKIKKMIKQRGKYDRTIRQQYLKIVEKKGAIRTKYNGANYLKNNPKIKARCQQEVRKELPGHLFFIPEV